jgi:putative transposase
MLEAFRAGEGVELIRDGVQLVPPESIEVEAIEHSRRGQRYPVTECNGSAAALLTTHAGDVGRRIPKLCKGSFCRSILEPRRWIDQALYSVVMEAYVTACQPASCSADNGSGVAEYPAHLPAGADAELGEDLAHVPLHGAQADAHLGADFGVRVPGSRQVGDL